MNSRNTLAALVALTPLAVATPLDVGVAPAIATLVQESADARIEKGRGLLAQGKVAEAQIEFDAAAAAEPGVKTSVWVTRGWIAGLRFDDALLAIDELKAKKASAGLVDYLYGMAFLGQAKNAVATGATGQYTQSQFEDALRSLKKAVNADAARFADAWLALAEAAWYSQDLEAGREAADKALAFDRSNPEAQVIQGRVHFSAYVAEQDAAAKDKLWNSTYAAFEKAIVLLGTPDMLARQSLLADVHVQMGYLKGWKEDKVGAGASFANALAWDPSRIDFPKAYALLGSVGFLAMCEEGSARFTARAGESDARNATASWWRGFAQFENAKWAECEASFRNAVRLWPAFVNSWYYVYRAAFSQQRYAEAIEGLVKFRQLDAEGLVQTIAGDLDRNRSVLNGLIAWCVDPEKQKGALRNEDAAMICALFTQLEPGEARHWNNLGLFVRDQGCAAHEAWSEAGPRSAAGAVGSRPCGLRACPRAQAQGPEHRQRHRGDAALLLEPRVRPRRGDVQALEPARARRARAHGHLAR
jgi:tetratricopeptide (TPR) repeat protein